MLESGGKVNGEGVVECGCEIGKVGFAEFSELSVSRV